MMAEQRVMDMEKTSAKDISAANMLEFLNKDVSRNRSLLHYQLNSELNEKMKKMQEMAVTLSEPSLSHKELEVLHSETMNLMRENREMESKVSKGNPHDDKLSIYKQRLNLISKKREKLLDTIKNFTVEYTDLEQRVKEKESQSGLIINRENLKQVLGDIKAKNAKFKQLSNYLKDIKTERAVLSNTELILQRSLEDSREQLHNMECERGMQGIHGTADEITKMAMEKRQIDQSKEELMVELSKDVALITTTIAEKKKELEPSIMMRKKLNEEVSSLEKVYNEKKSYFDSVITDVEAKLEKLLQDVNTTETECSNYESRLF